MEFENLHKSIFETQNSFIKKLKQKLPKETGSLINSVEASKDKFSFEILIADYFKFIDQGVNGTENSVGSIFSYSKKKPPIKSIEGFANRKGINKWALQNSLFKKGIKPQKISEKIVFEDFEENILDAYIKDIQDGIRQS